MNLYNLQEAGKRLSEVIQAAGLNSRQFATKVGVDPSYLSKMEQGKKGISKNILDILQKDFNVDPLWLLYGTSVPREVGTQVTENETSYLNLYIQSLLDNKRILEDQNNFLRRNFEFSLTSLAEVQQASLNHIKALAWYSASKHAGENVKGTVIEMEKINSKVSEFLGADLRKDTHGSH